MNAQEHLKQLAYELSDKLAAWLVRNRDVFGDLNCLDLLLSDEPLSYEEAEQGCYLIANYAFIAMEETLHDEITLIYCALMREQGMYKTDITKFVKYGERN